MKTKNILFRSLYSLVLVFVLVVVSACGTTPATQSSLKFADPSYELFVGQTKTVNLTVSSDVNLADVVLTASDPEVLEVSGLNITALKKGYSTLTATHAGLNLSAVVNVSVKINEGFLFKESTYELNKGDSIYIEMTLENGIALEDVSFASSDKAIAKVSGTRLIAVKPGEVTITATYGEYIAVAKVIVTLSAEELANVEAAKKFDEAVDALLSEGLEPSAHIAKAKELLAQLATLESQALILVEKEELLKASIVDATISALPEVIKHSDEKIVKAARELYRTSDYDVRNLVTKLSVLEAKEAELAAALAQYEVDKADASEMDALILSLPTVPVYTDVLTILEVSAKYDAMNEQAKGLVKKASTLNSILKKVATLQSTVQNIKENIRDFEAVVKLLPETISADAQAEVVKSALDAYLKLDETAKVHLSAEAYAKLEKAIMAANEYYGNSAHTLSELENELESIVNATPLQILFDFEFAQTALENATSSWEYAAGQDSSIHDLATGQHNKLMLNPAKRNVVFTLTSGLVTLTKELSIDFGVLVNNQKGLFYNNDARTLSSDEAGTSTTLGWSGYTLSYGLYNMFILAGNVFEIESVEELSQVTIANPLYATVVVNDANEKLTINFADAKDKLGQSFFGNSAVVIRDGAVVAVHKQAGKITLLPGEVLYSTRDLDASSITNNFLAPASSIKAGTKVSVVNWNEYTNPFEVEQEANYLVVDKSNPSSYQTIASAISAAQDGDTIYVAAGDYSNEVFTISKAITLVTDNANISSLAYRKASVKVGSVTISGNGAKVFGFDFTEIVIVRASNVELSNNVLTGINATGSNLVVTGNTFIQDIALQSSQIDGLVFTNNTVTAVSRAIVVTKLLGIVEITDNIFKDVYSNAIEIYEADTEELFINRNEFVNVTDTAILVRNYAPTQLVTNINVLYNTFGLVGTGIKLEANLSDAIKNQYTSLAISYNDFNDVEAEINLNNKGLSSNVDIYHNISDGSFSIIHNGYEVVQELQETLVATPLYNEVVKENLIYPLYAYVDGTVHADLYAISELPISFYPARSNVTELYFVSSNEAVLRFTEDGMMEGLKKGVVQVEAYFKHNDKLAVKFDVEVDVAKRVEVRYEDYSWVQTSYDIMLNASLEGTDETKEIIWTSSDENVATVDNGRVTGISEGVAYITATAKGTELSMTVGVTVLDEIDEVTKYVLEQSNANIYIQNAIHVTGYQFTYKHDIYSSVSKLYLYDNPIIEAMVDLSQSNRPGTKKTSVEYVTVHDTASSAETANGLAHARYVQEGGGGTSWHYTAANDGIYHHIPDDEVAYHAGDGTGVAFGLLKTNVKVLPTTDIKITIDQVTGNFLINGNDTGLVAPKDNGQIVPNSRINDCGIRYEVGEDGYYYLGKTWYSSTYERVSNYGGNNNSIGIETCVNIGSDLYMTWQKTANLVGKLLIENNLDLTRVKPHHFFSGKNCPQTMRDNKLYYEHFLYLVEAEYNFMKDFSGYKVLGKSNSLEYVLDNGRVKVQPLYSTSVSYDITISNGEYTNTITLFSVIPGQYNN